MNCLFDKLKTFYTILLSYYCNSLRKAKIYCRILIKTLTILLCIYLTAEPTIAIATFTPQVSQNEYNNLTNDPVLYGIEGFSDVIKKWRLEKTVGKRELKNTRKEISNNLNDSKSNKEFKTNILHQINFLGEKVVDTTSVFGNRLVAKLSVITNSFLSNLGF